MKNTLEGINSRKTEAEEWISELEDRKVEITAKEGSGKIQNSFWINKNSSKVGITVDNCFLNKIVTHSNSK